MSSYASLLKAFEERADGVVANGRPLVGVFGEGVPVPLINAMGGVGIDVKAPPLADAVDGPIESVVSKVTEPFLDPFAARFLHRFAAGAFDRFAALIFVRDDVAGLAAYQYASELRRQGQLTAQGPSLHLWNMLHTKSTAAEVFNQAEQVRLVKELEQSLGAQCDADALNTAIMSEAARNKIVGELPSGGQEAFIARNTGRWLTAEGHSALLADLSLHTFQGPKIALAGTACDTPVLHAVCEAYGQIIADIQDYGRSAPFIHSAESMLTDLAGDGLSLRAAPPDRFTRALHKATEDADLVVVSVDENDDAFGWEVPALKRATEDRGARFVNLGFRPFRPDAAWCDGASTLISEALA